MASRYSTEEVRSIVKSLEIEAKLAGMIPQDSGLDYQPGNVTNGISGTVMCYQRVEGVEGRSHREFIRDADAFLPEFNYKMTRTDHARLLTAALNVFFAFRRKKEEDERLAKQVWSG